MAAERYVVLGLAQARSPWFRAVAQWANASSIPAEFVKCVSAEDLRARLASGRPHSALLVDAALPALDRDLIDTARRSGCLVVVVDDRRLVRDWAALGASAVLAETFDRDELLDAIAPAAMIARGDALPDTFGPAPAKGWQARVAVVCGPGGTGASSAAIALAQGLGADVRHGGMVVLADLARCAEQAMLHDARDVVPGVQELVEAYRGGRPSNEDVRALTFGVENRGYHLLLGLRRARAWSTVRPRSFEAAFDGLRRAFRVVVCDTDADVEGEAEGGSLEVEERNVLARTCVAQADVVFVVGLPGMKGLHALVRVVSDLLAFGVPAANIVATVNRAPRSPRQRAEVAATLDVLLGGQVPLSSPLFLPDRRVDEALRDGVPLPAAMAAPLVGAFGAVSERAGAARRPSEGPHRLLPGVLGLRDEDHPDDGVAGSGPSWAVG